MVITLDDTDEEILLHIARYRLTLPEILAKAEVAGVHELAAAQQILERLRRAGYLLRAELQPESPGTHFYQLTPKGAGLIGHDAELAKPLKRDARLECFAILQFCCSGPVFRQLFTKAEFQERFKDYWFPGQPVRYYLEPDANGSARLAFLKVDLDGQGRWERLIDACSRFLRKRTSVSHVAAQHRAQTENFARLVTQGRFQFSALTALPEKKRAIEIELQRRKAVGERTPPIQAYLVEGLFDAMFPAQ